MTCVSGAGTYYYRATYAGNATYTNAVSIVVTVTVTRLPTSVNATVPITAHVKTPFTINGTLTRVGFGIAS